MNCSMAKSPIIFNNVFYPPFYLLICLKVLFNCYIENYNSRSKILTEHFLKNVEGCFLKKKSTYGHGQNCQIFSKKSLVEIFGHLVKDIPIPNRAIGQVMFDSFDMSIVFEVLLHFEFHEKISNLGKKR